MCTYVYVKLDKYVRYYAQKQFAKNKGHSHVVFAAIVTDKEAQLYCNKHKKLH